MAEEAEQTNMALKDRAVALREIAKDTRVIAGTLGERDLERVRAEIDEAIATLESGAAPAWAVGDRLRSIAGALDTVLYMSGINPRGGSSVRELQQRLFAWLDANRS